MLLNYRKAIMLTAVPYDDGYICKKQDGDTVLYLRDGWAMNIGDGIARWVTSADVATVYAEADDALDNGELMLSAPVAHRVVQPATETATVVFHLLYAPGENHLGFMTEAETFMATGVITAMPRLTVTQGESGLAKCTLTVPACDRPFWLGFYVGLNYCRNNRQITVGP